MTKRITIVAVLASAAVAGAQPRPCTSSATGDLHVESFQNATYGETQTLRVWLPPGYNDAANAQKKYPVLYLLDGQNAFDDCTAFSGEKEWRVDETLSRLISERRIPPIIVVGIDSGNRRTYQYAPYRDLVVRPQEPEPIGKQLPTYLGREVLPYVAARYRATSDPGQTAIGGASLAAAAALYALLTRSDLFGLGLLESASLQVGNGQLLRDTEFLVRGPQRVSIGVGSTEFATSGGRQMAAQMGLVFDQLNEGAVKMAEALARNLRAAFINTPDIRFVVEPNGTHTSDSWARRFPEAVAFLFATR